MSKVLPALMGVSMLGLVGMANAAEPVTLTNAQMDEVTAGDAAQLQVTSVPSNVIRTTVTGTNQYGNTNTIWDSSGNPARAAQFQTDVQNGTFTTRSWWWTGIVTVVSTFANGTTYTNAYDVPSYNKSQVVTIPFYNILGR